MEVKNVSVYNFGNAFRGMRNPLNSWKMSDSYFDITQLDDSFMRTVRAYAGLWAATTPEDSYIGTTEDLISDWVVWVLKNGILKVDKSGVEEVADVALIGPKDMKLARRLCESGTEHRKFLRQILVSIDITAPLYWWKEFDTYKVGTVANSTSTMHKLTSKPITLDSFEIDDWTNIQYPKKAQREDLRSDIDEDFVQMCLIPYLEYLRISYLQTVSADPDLAKVYWKELVRWLPESWLQTRTVTLNYEVLRNIYHQRSMHKLTEWHTFCEFIKSLPYANDLIIG